NANDYHIDRTSRCVSRARRPGCAGHGISPILPATGALDRPAYSAAMEGGQSAADPVAFIRAMTAMGLDPMIVRLS
ncbi:hypothetical protein, partial [Stenotrophomonas maltophilia]|uniref:hypothetical protein n=1 Tax=Stenotrophomonas maltophilia TaxID=40324 RepID=UPI001C400F9D